MYCTIHSALLFLRIILISSSTVAEMAWEICAATAQTGAMLVEPELAFSRLQLRQCLHSLMRTFG
jgi:hypothetical protein